jgi:YVTN family beta-propeller protein
MAPSNAGATRWLSCAAILGALTAGLPASANAQTVTATLGAGDEPNSVAVNPVTNKIYVANQSSNNVTVIDGASNSTTTVAAGSDDQTSVAVNPVTNKIYVANSAVDTVTVIDGATNTTTSVAVGLQPQAMAVNPVTNKVYVANFEDDTVTVIDGATNTTATVGVGLFADAVAVNPVTNKIYVANYYDGTVTVIDGATNSTSTVVAGSGPNGAAVNPVTNKVYVSNYYSGTVTVIDGATNSTSTVAAGSGPYAVAVNPVTNKVYVANISSRTVTVIDGAANTTTTVAVGNPFSVAVNPVTNKIYVPNEIGGTVTVIDGATNTTTTVAAGAVSLSVAVNPVTNKIYVPNHDFSGAVTVIDGATNTTTTVAAGSGPYAVAVNPVTNKVYVADIYDNTVTVIDEQQVEPIPLTTSIHPLPDNQADGPTPSFTFSAQSTTATTPGNVFFQVDTWQNLWSTATGNNPTFSGTVAPLQPGFHIIYAYAGDGQEATSTQIGSPLTGTMQAYGFLVPAAGPVAVSVSPNSGSGTTQTFTAVYSDPSGVAAADLANVQIIFNTTPNETNACYVMYLNELLYLQNDGGTGWSAGITPGSAATVSNSQCTLAGTGSSYSASGDIATLGVALTFTGSFGGPKNIYLRATERNGSSSGWVQMGTWGSSVGPPAVVSVSPNSGSGTTQMFTGVYSDPNGAPDLRNVQILINTTASGAHACYVMCLDRILYLQNDSWTGWSAGVTPGSLAQVSNSQCTLSGASSSYSISGSTTTLNVAVTFNSSFAGTKNIYLRATESDSANASSGWILKGTWTP